jgi:ribosomal protein S18 acetylase RimI-like enzyme
MRLTPAEDDDLDEVAALVNRAYRADEGWTNEAAYLAGERTSAAALRADLAASPEATLLTLRDEPEGPLLGLVWLEPAAAEAWYLGMLTVRPDLQDRQLGRRLLEEAEAFAIAHGARRVRMTVVSVRDTLIAWYERRGYRLNGEREPFPYEDQRFGLPNRPDLEFVVLEKQVRARTRPPARPSGG